MKGISTIITVIAEEVPLLPRVLGSVADFSEEIVLVDMTGGEEVRELATSYPQAKVYNHKFVPYVEVVRNYGLSKARCDWILILDPDEEVPASLATKLVGIAENPIADYFRLPRKNIVFGKWMQHSRWWPDYNIRFFKRGSVAWTEMIHVVPLTKGKGEEVEAVEDNAIIHHNYASLTQYLARMDRYSSIQAMEIGKKNYRFVWIDLIRRPMGEFMSRYFAGEGYKDGVHGLALSLLQAFSELLVYIKLWEKEKFMEQGITAGEISQEFGSVMGDMRWWVDDMLIKNKNVIAALPLRVKRKVKSAIAARRNKK